MNSPRGRRSPHTSALVSEPHNFGSKSARWPCIGSPVDAAASLRELRSSTPGNVLADCHLPVSPSQRPSPSPPMDGVFGCAACTAGAEWRYSGPPQWTKSAYTVGMRRLTSLGALFLLSIPAIAARQVALLTEGELAPPALYGLAKLKDALRAKGFDVSGSAAQADCVIFAGIGPSAATQEWKAPVPAGREALTIWRGRHQNKPAISLRGGDARGLMYAALDTADRVAWSSSDPFQYVRDTAEKPYLAERGISMYTMQRAYFESRLYDENYWKRYFDTWPPTASTASSSSSATKTAASWRPSIPTSSTCRSFPTVEHGGPRQADSRRKNPAAFRTHDPPRPRTRHRSYRGHLGPHLSRRRPRRRHSRRLAECRKTRARPRLGSHRRKPRALYQSRTAPISRSLPRNRRHPVPHARRIRTQARRDGSPSGTTSSPTSNRPIPTCASTCAPRASPTPSSTTPSNLGLKAKISTKYWMEQMGLPFHPTHINPQDQHNRRHGYADLLRYPQRYRVHWQLWNGGTTRLLLWGDPDYVRRFAAPPASTMATASKSTKCSPRKCSANRTTKSRSTS